MSGLGLITNAIASIKQGKKISEKYSKNIPLKNNNNENFDDKEKKTVVVDKNDNCNSIPRNIVMFLLNIINLSIFIYAIYLSFKVNAGFNLLHFLMACCCSICYLPYGLYKLTTMGNEVPQVKKNNNVVNSLNTLNNVVNSVNTPVNTPVTPNSNSINSQNSNNARRNNNVKRNIS